MRYLALCCALILAAPAQAADAIKIASTHSTSNAPILIAKQRGFFAAEGLDAEIVFIESAGPITTGVVSGDLDFGATGLSGAFYNLAGQLKVIAGHIYEAPGFRGTTLVASNRAWDAGLKSYKDLPGHSIAVTQIGTPLHYTIGLLAERYGFEMKSVRVLPMQSFPNAVAAAVGGSADAAMVSAVFVQKPLQAGEIKLIGYPGEEMPMQVGAVFVSTKTANDRRDMVERFLKAFRRGTRAYHDAFTGPDGKLAFAPGSDEIIKLLAETNHQPGEQIKESIAFVDADARVDVKDIRRQIAWYKSQGMVKAEVDPDSVIDQRYIIALPPR